MAKNDGGIVGANLPWFFGAYGHDLAPTERHADWGHSFDAFRAYRPLVEAASLGLRAVRVWLCEGSEGIVTDRDGRIDGAHPALLESIRAIEAGARIAGLRVYWTLLDGNAAGDAEDRLTRAIVTDPDQRARFAARVAAPVARAMDPRVSMAVEVISSPGSLCDGEATWAEVGRTARMVGDAIRAEHGALLVTVGTGADTLSRLWRGEPALDAVDVHAYSAEGWLPSRAELADSTGDARVADGTLPLIAGECGLPDGADPRGLAEYLPRASQHGYDAVFLWRLEGALIDTADGRRVLTPAAEAVRARLA